MKIIASSLDSGAFDEEWMRHVGSLVYPGTQDAKPNGTTTSATALEATRNITTDSSTAHLRRCAVLYPVWSLVTPYRTSTCIQYTVIERTWYRVHFGKNVIEETV